jgi:hypothetical protein
MNNIPELLEWIRNVNIKTLPYKDVVGVGWGPKVINGEETEEYSIIFTVREKKPLDELTIEELVPKNFNLNDSIYVTDVKEPILHSKISNRDCFTLGSTVEPIRSNCTRRRPLKSGCESENNWGAFVATLGTFVIDRTDGQIVALSNNHVFGNSQVTARYLTTNYFGDKNTLTLSAFQPTGTYKTTRADDYIGMSKRPVVIGDIDSDLYAGYISETSCDAAIVKLSKYTDLIDSTSLQPIGFNYASPYRFATDSEIDSLLNPQSVNYGAPLFRSGRTIGPVGYPGNTSSCNISAYAFDDALVGDYNGYTSYFSNSFLVRGDVVAGRGGDSGSMFLGLFNRNNPSLSAWKVIGLLFAGPSTSFPAYTIGCRITSIVKELNIAPWDGITIPTLSASTDYKTVGYTDPIAITSTVALSGRTYYQLGRA